MSGRVPGEQVTIADVARHAGVAASTVSYVLSGKRTISATTRGRVLDSVRALGYHPHAGARALASRRANVIALVLPLRTGMQVPVVMRFATAVVTTARRYDHDVLLVTADEGPAGLHRIAGSALVDGVLLMDVELEDSRVPLLRELALPGVLIGHPADSTGLACVDLDFRRAGELCVEHLAAAGHRRIALLGAPAAVYDRGTGFAHRTRAGVRAAAGRLGVDAVTRPCEEGPAAVRRDLEALLADHPDVTGLVVQNESAVGPVLATLPLLGRRVPRDVSVVAICPDELAEQSGLTCVPVPAEEVGRQAVALLMRRLSGEGVPEVTLLEPHLTVRDTSARR
ncbi:LacI family DNA-binding transcriptional regulator [Micromonospora chalcea]|uniref:LacI family DNA-binding transcriptional regulator n=1 Tax=Micromonospora TaxID=1873 RepID=UPI000DEBD903|nr:MULTISPECIES: LacI family DNA-binding transcriptional regulator [unclassified Micromonospora]MBP1783424.1 DNA-binding LacI/PurR family transcriptional regulator [Micromonospora sp. HB375]MBQ1059740.1 LacI family DNA-binding transcriptional regulator [Micromonospora sp. C41]MDH6469073.1 DNA-binding LacI/PurR family transcriptional regulator [Micromonospora sp. H404/HB375]NHO84370.1 LacI family transcriptional regulator [Micromonospora sp. CMU55-4]RBQ06025.1 LacI family transcriptional regula